MIVRLTERDRPMLVKRALCRWLTTDQLKRLYFPRTTLNAVQKRLRKLADDGLLRSYREHPVVCVNSLVSYNTANKHDALFLDETRAWLKALTDRNIEAILAHTPVMRCSGASAAGHPEWDAYIAKIDGDVSGLYGLPRKLTQTIIENETRS